jgi:hypothetical protein
MLCWQGSGRNSEGVEEVLWCAAIKANTCVNQVTIITALKFMEQGISQHVQIKCVNTATRFHFIYHTVYCSAELGS